MRLAIAVPSHDYVPAPLIQDLPELYAYTREILGEHVQLAVQCGTYVHANRERLLAELIRYGATHILWIDTDMRFPRDAALQLLRHDVAFVGCNCATRYVPSQFTATRGGVRVPTRATSSGLEAVDTVGLAVFLMETAAVAQLPRPWFFHTWDHERARANGEDEYFCHQVRASGQQIFIDHDLSHSIEHVGPYAYRVDAIPSEVSP